MIEELARDFAAGFEGHFMRALFISGALALAATAVAAFAWWRGRRWMTNRGTGRFSPLPHTAMFSQDPPPGADAAGGTERREEPASRDEQPGGRLIREAAARAAGLRDAWDRSYREARSGEPGPDPAPRPQLDLLIEELLREQRETNALLRQIASRLEDRR